MMCAFTGAKIVPLEGPFLGPFFTGDFGRNERKRAFLAFFASFSFSTPQHQALKDL